MNAVVEPSPWRLSACFLLTCCFMVAGCSQQPAAEPAGTKNAANDQWPRQFANVDGSHTTLPAQPARILSTSVTVTGTLLAIDAPVIASASAADGSFFGQWAQTAKERGVENAWPAGRVDIEAAYALAPDLIVVASSGADSAVPQLPQLRAVAPTIVVNYGDKSWEELARELGQATGHEAQAGQRVQAFDSHVQQVRGQLQLPEGRVNVISYLGPALANPVATATGMYGQLLHSLGFEVENPDPSWHSSGGTRTDFVWVPYEKLLSLQAPGTFLVNVDDSGTGAFLHDPILANLPSVRSGQVYGLGENTFRIDYFSATAIVDSILKRFGSQPAGEHDSAQNSR